jgi:uncharacterized protein (DUF4415 family)
MKKESKSEWERIDAMTDGDIDTSEIPPLGQRFFKKAALRKPRRQVSVTLSIDADVLEWFQAHGEDLDQRVNAALRIYAEAHKVIGQ